MIALNIFLMIFGFGGWFFALWVNESWYKKSIEQTDDWAEFTHEIIEEMGERNVRLAEEIDRLRSDKNDA